MLKDIQLGGVASADHSYIHQTNLEVVDVSDPDARIEVPRGGAAPWQASEGNAKRRPTLAAQPDRRGRALPLCAPHPRREAAFSAQPGFPNL